MDEDWQTEEEIEAHVGPGGPVQPAREWLTDMVAGDVAAAWPKTDPTYRLVHAQAWIWANRTHPMVEPFDRDTLAAALASSSSSHPLWPNFAQSVHEEIRERYGDFTNETYGAASRPRPVGPDFEMVKLIKVEEGTPLAFTGPTLVRGAVLLMHRTEDGWLVAGLGTDAPGIPGWPPTPGREAL
jgi:hypothetical protein